MSTTNLADSQTLQSPTPFIPTTVVKNATVKQRRVGLIAPSGGGKTTSALTFPNPIVLDFDNGLVAFDGIDTVPFHDYDFICKYNEGKYKPKSAGDLPNRKDALKKWLETDGMKLQRGQTLILDSWTSIQNAFDSQQKLDRAITNSGEDNKFVFWDQKIVYSEFICAALMSMKCDVVVTFHEQQVREKKTGVLLNKIAPIMQGSFAQEVKIYFTDFYRIITEEKENDKGEVFGSDYYWQIRADNFFDPKCQFKNLPVGIFKVPAHYRFFEIASRVVEEKALKEKDPAKVQEEFNKIMKKEIAI